MCCSNGWNRNWNNCRGIENLNENNADILSILTEAFNQNNGAFSQNNAASVQNSGVFSQNNGAAIQSNVASAQNSGASIQNNAASAQGDSSEFYNGCYWFCRQLCGQFRGLNAANGDLL